ncbi:cupin domain-containing protein [Tolypothrix sp. VBCCA 56010]|uniref:cupin domain-containing protein n=1 Tax=Tolypothrix sp. VBCCA 56010 TaxID=3137731 RepID=UPI003D7C4415
MTQQTFINTNTQQWDEIKEFSGTQILPLAEPVPQGSIHRLRMSAGTIIPVHHHPCDEYVYVIQGTIETGGRECKAGTFWFTPANAKNGSHKAITDVEIITIRLGEMGVVENCKN